MVTGSTESQCINLTTTDALEEHALNPKRQILLNPASHKLARCTAGQTTARVLLNVNYNLRLFTVVQAVFTSFAGGLLSSLQPLNPKPEP